MGQLPEEDDRILQDVSAELGQIQVRKEDTLLLWWGEGGSGEGNGNAATTMIAGEPQATNSNEGILLAGNSEFWIHSRKV